MLFSFKNIELTFSHPETTLSIFQRFNLTACPKIMFASQKLRWTNFFSEVVNNFEAILSCSPKIEKVKT